jgi:hypothetical protein
MQKVDSNNKISIDILKVMAEKMLGGLVKAVVDLQKEIMVIDAELHADEEQLLLEEGSKQEDLWGINIYPDNFPVGEWIEFDSMINIRPAQGNRSRNVENKNTQEAIKVIVKRLINNDMP